MKLLFLLLLTSCATPNNCLEGRLLESRSCFLGFCSITYSCYYTGDEVEMICDEDTDCD